MYHIKPHSIPHLQNFRLNTCFFLGILLVAICKAYGQPVSLQGFVPQKITKAMISHEYRRIYEQLAPHKHIDQHPLSVTFFTTRGTARQDYALPEWGGGGAIGRDSIVVALDAEPFLYTDFARITVHELVHIVIGRICTTAAVPRWFHEGVAMALSGDVTSAEHVALSRAIFTGSLMPLASIDSVNAFGRHRARLAYAQSHQAVLFLVRSYGIEVLSEILSRSAQQGSFWGGMRETLQLSEREIEGMIRSYLIRKFRLVFFFADTYLLWLGIVLLFAVGYTVTAIRNRRRAAAMADEEERETAASAGQAGQ
ncbi:MAG: hypothetical protein GF418_04330 [Chitinivibrionales bacterium]|nr:hypothetical protein [Chitinivibrionales bacterium]MBD3394835.1 hypothetical protein [Chitinivibrionales bacterium]